MTKFAAMFLPLIAAASLGGCGGDDDVIAEDEIDGRVVGTDEIAVEPATQQIGEASDLPEEPDPIGVTEAGGTFVPVNPQAGDVMPAGTVSLVRQGEDILMTLNAVGLSEGTHLVHLHGFTGEEPGAARCATMAADANDDGYVDLMETHDVSGETLIPLSQNPASLDIKGADYPRAGEDGALSYEARADRAALSDSVQERFGTPLALTRRVVYIHGVAEGTDLPGSVRSLEGVPATATLPVACAEIEPR